MSGAPPAAGATGSRLALIVANATYDDAGLAGLVSPAADAADLARALGAAETCGFTVATVVDATSAEVGQTVEDFLADRDRADLLLLYFSCHGLKDEQGRLYFAARNTRRDRLRSTAVPAGFVNELLLACRSRRKVLILDCCYSGAFAKGMQVKADPQVHTVDQFDARGLIVLTASDATQYAFEGDAVRGSAAPSAFTAALVSGLDTGEADIDRDGLISVDDAHEYVRRRLTDQPRMQNPRKWEFDVQGRIVIGRSARPADAAPAGDLAAAPPAVLPPRPAPPATQAAPPFVRQRAWWAAVLLLLAGTIAVTDLVGWWPVNLAYDTLPSQFMPSERRLVIAVHSAAAAWTFAYAAADATARTRNAAPARWPDLLLRWVHILRTLARPSGPRQFLRAAATSVPLTIFVALTAAIAAGDRFYNTYGSDARDRVFTLVFVALTTLPIGMYLRTTESDLSPPEPAQEPASGNQDH